MQKEDRRKTWTIEAHLRLQWRVRIEEVATIDRADITLDEAKMLWERCKGAAKIALRP